MTLLQISQGRRKDVPTLASEATRLAEETQSDEPLATGHTLLGLVSSEQGNLDAAAEHYAQAIITAWEHHPSTGQRINRSILRHLRSLRQRVGNDGWPLNFCSLARLCR
jgi:hypothetical protein